LKVKELCKEFGNYASCHNFCWRIFL